MAHVDRMGNGKPHMAVDAAATIPARIGLVGVVYPYCHHVASLADVGRDVILKAGIPVRTLAHHLAVHIHTRIHIHAVELQKEPVAAEVGACERLPVPPHSSRQGSATPGV